jgi:5-methylcytosine-specific restriction enzyme A
MWSGGSTKRWRRVRRAKLQANPMCEWPGCGRPADVPHHETDDYDRDRYNPDVLWSLCHRHHADATANRRAGRRGVPMTR